MKGILTRREFLRRSTWVSSGSLFLPPAMVGSVPDDSANPSHVEFDDITSASGIRFAHERAASSEKLVVETIREYQLVCSAPALG